MRAEAAVPDADGELGAQARGDQRVRHVVDDERGDRQRRRVPWRGPSRRTPGMVATPSRSCRARRASCAAIAGQPRRWSSRAAAARATRADHVGRSGFLAVGRGGPDDLVEVDQVDGAAADQERVAVLERRPWADQRAGAERRVHLVPAEGDEVGVGGERPVRRELRAVDQDRDATRVRGRDDLARSAASSR